MSLSNIVIRTTRVLAEPTGKSRTEKLAGKLGKVRKHKRAWVEPSDATMILPMHFNVVSPKHGIHYAEMSLEIPMAGGFDYYTVVRGGKTRHDALLLVIKEIENSEWFHIFKKQGVYFYVTGGEMENLYRGYL